MARKTTKPAISFEERKTTVAYRLPNRIIAWFRLEAERESTTYGVLIQQILQQYADGNLSTLQLDIGESKTTPWIPRWLKPDDLRRAANILEAMAK
jgi:hypothetical protein